MDFVLEFIVMNGGIHATDDYSYKGVQGQCDYNGVIDPKVTIVGFENVPQNDENLLKKVVAHQPLCVSIEAGGRAFQLYELGFFYWIMWLGKNGYIKLELNVVSTDRGKCGKAMHPSHFTNNPGLECDDFFSCPRKPHVLLCKSFVTTAIVGDTVLLSQPPVVIIALVAVRKRIMFVT
ncbi:hypothetical protein AgCh_033997 [Apium graveolens]